MPGTCSSPSPTSPPGGSCTPGSYCSGTACTGCGVGTDTYCGAGGTCNDVRTVSGNFCNDCTYCAPGSGICPVPSPGGGGGPPPPPPPGGGGGCSLCGYVEFGQVCCASGDICYGGPPAACIPGGGFGGGPAPATDISGMVFYDLNGDGIQNGSDSPASGILILSYANSAFDTQVVTTGGGGAYSVPVLWGTTSYTLSPIGLTGYISIPSSRTASKGDSGINFGLWTGNTISGAVFIDTNSNGTKDIGESGHGGAAIVLGGAASANTTSSGTGAYSFGALANGSYTVTLTVPSGYILTNPPAGKSTVLNNSSPTINFGIRQNLPVCTGGLSAIPAFVSPGGTSTLSVTSCTDVENPNNGVPPPPFSWNPDINGNNPPPTLGVQTDTPTSSTTNWTAPNCPSTLTTYRPQVTVGGAGGTTSYNTSITVPATVGVTAHVRSVTSVGACNTSSGNPYSGIGGTGATLNINNSGSVNLNQTTNGGSGSTAFTCLPQGNYQLTLQVPAGYSVLGTDVSPAVESAIGTNRLSFATGSTSQTAVFCIAPIDPWFQTDLGDVRFVNLTNPIPAGKYGSLGENVNTPQASAFPGIFYSSSSNVDLGSGGDASASIKQWVVNNEYLFNSNTVNRNGGMSYDFYKAKAYQDGVTVTPLVPGILEQDQIVGNGVYESNGDLVINSYNHVNGRRVVILVNGNVTITTPISVPINQGIFIVAAKRNITIVGEIGAAVVTSTASNLDGYYTAQGSIYINGGGCADGENPDKRLNIGGALVANSLKPFAASGTGIIHNDRSLCIENLNYPSLYVVSRPDFLIQLTDFYKTTYTKWREVNP
ncbi:MAG: SdrD B-like domain-containing protein [Candidatus Levybacteria bacterium]|nr:SdrD B-like domain-containing protein [Candidatus Levybacteria bacterium]